MGLEPSRGDNTGLEPSRSFGTRARAAAAAAAATDAWLAGLMASGDGRSPVLPPLGVPGSAAAERYVRGGMRIAAA